MPARPRSSRSSSSTRGSCTGCSRPRPAGSATRTAGGAGAVASPASRRSAVPAGRVPGHRHRLAARAASRLSYWPPAATASSTPCCPPTRPPGGMFRRWPFFQRLLSWTKPYAPRGADRARVPALRLEQPRWPSSPSCASLQTEFMDGSSYFPSRPEMQANLEAFAERAGIAVRYGCRWESHAARGRRPGRRRRSSLETSDGEYRSRYLVLRGRRRRSRGARRRRASSTPATTPTRATRRGTRASGCSSSASRTPGFELASGLASWASAITCRSPVARQDVDRDAVAGRASGPATCSRSRTTSSGWGCRLLDASIDAIDAASATRFRVDLKRTDNGEALSVEADEVIAATGFTCPLLDLPALGVDDVRPGEAAGRDAAVGERDRARDLLRRHDQPGVARAAEARHPVLLGRGPRPPLQRADPRPAHRGDALRDRAPSGRSSTPADVRVLPPPRGDPRPRAVAPEGVPRAGDLARPTTASATRGSCRSSTRSTG